MVSNIVRDHLNMDIGGTNSGEFDQLMITGTANLNGDLNISLLDGYTPTVGDTFDILTFGDHEVAGFA